MFWFIGLVKMTADLLLEVLKTLVHICPTRDEVMNKIVHAVNPI